MGQAANRGVQARRAKDEAAETDAEIKRQEALQHKADLYDRLQRGEEVSDKVSAAALVDFELKQLNQHDSTVNPFAFTDGREAARLQWEQQAREELVRPTSGAASQHRAGGAKRRRF